MDSAYSSTQAFLFAPLDATIAASRPLDEGAEAADPEEELDPALAAGGRVAGDPYFLAESQTPSQEGPEGIRFDFNNGCRVLLPPGKWRVRVDDRESGNPLYVCDVNGGWVVSAKRYYIPFRLRVWRRGEKAPLLDHAMDLEGKPVLIKFPIATLGDMMAWFPYAAKFREKHRCRLECSIGREIADLFRDQYPDIAFSSPPDKCMQNPYASYRTGLFYNNDYLPYDFRQVGLQRSVGYALGVDPEPVRPRLRLDAPRDLDEPYVCIATKATAMAKMWLNGDGWEALVRHLKNLGYRVLCIDRYRSVGKGWIWNHFPLGAEDFTGNLPLQSRVDLLRHAEFFIGLPSGLSWLAWATGIPVVMISGFSLPGAEFATPYRVTNTHGCYGCWDDMAVRYDAEDFLWCPRHKGTERQFECTRLITPRQVVGTVERLRRELGLRAPWE